jgi:hypothetical protein
MTNKKDKGSAKFNFESFCDENLGVAIFRMCSGGAITRVPLEKGMFGALLSPVWATAL